MTDRNNALTLLRTALGNPKADFHDGHVAHGQFLHWRYSANRDVWPFVVVFIQPPGSSILCLLNRCKNMLIQPVLPDRQVVKEALLVLAGFLYHRGRILYLLPLLNRTQVMEINGKIIELLPEKSGESANGAWRKQEYILETDTQYPKKNPLTLLRYIWRWFDFDGFYGVVLQKDDSISKKYQDW